jgi:hypothetical protein
VELSDLRAHKPYLLLVRVTALIRRILQLQLSITLLSVEEETSSSAELSILGRVTGVSKPLDLAAVLPRARLVQAVEPLGDAAPAPLLLRKLLPPAQQRRRDREVRLAVRRTHACDLKRFVATLCQATGTSHELAL